MEKLNENPQVEALLNALEQNGLHQEKAEVQSLVQYVGSMEKTLADMRSTLQSMREEVAKIHDSTLRGKCQKLAEKADSRIKQSFAALKETKDNLLQSAANALRAFREKGKDALAESVRAMKIPEVLDKLASFFQRQSKDMAQEVVSVRALNAELQSTKGHLKNIGRVLVGKAPKEVAAPNPDKGILAMYAGTIEKEQKRYDSLAQKAMNAADKLRSARVKSLMANLNRCKEEVKRSAPSAPPLTHSRGHKPMEK